MKEEQRTVDIMLMRYKVALEYNDLAIKAANVECNNRIDECDMLIGTGLNDKTLYEISEHYKKVKTILQEKL